MGNQFGWQIGAVCRGLPSYIFFPDEKRPEDDPYSGMVAHDWCARCPVKSKCREFAYLHDAFGYWGDSSESERAKTQSPEDRQDLRDFKLDTGEYWPLYGHN